jgi:DNA polymerase-3 subunit epsilon/CBS domain-containing protein
VCGKYEADFRTTTLAPDNLMAAVTNATPLISLDAVVLDTETTGLDPRKARLIDAAAVRIAAGRIETKGTFQSYVNPREPIPAYSTEVHGIDDGKVAHAPAFGSMWPKLQDYIGNSVVVGHTVGFDLAILQQECRRAGMTWAPVRALDTQHLAQLVDPHRAGNSLEELAAWLGVPVSGRHSALGDAMTTAAIFQALLPKLRESGIRTFAEATQGCRTLTSALDRQYRAGWVTPDAAIERDAAARGLNKIDSYPYRHRVRDVMSTPPKIIGSDRTLGEALSELIRARISSVYVAPPNVAHDRLPAYAAGIITERDVLRALAIEGEGALKLGIEQFMSRPLATVPADAFVYRAIGRMSRMKIRHLGVTDEAGFLTGALSARDLLRLRAGEAVSLGDEIDEADTVPALGAAWAKLPHVSASLLAEGVGVRDIAAVISRELSALTRQAAVIAERRMLEAGEGDPPCPYAMTVLGSAGRGESLLAMDQDNAIVFEQGEPDGSEDKWFARLGKHTADILNEVGVPYCKGGVMASNAQWRGSVATWHARIADWITRSRPEDLLSVDIFFDMRAVYGRIGLADGLWREAFDMAKGQTGFAKLLAESAGRVEHGTGLFGRIRTTKGRIDLKRAGLFGIVSTARVLAIQHHVLERATPARLLGVRALDIGGDADIGALIEAHAAFLEFILSQQLEDIQEGRPATNAVAVKRLSGREHARLQTALQAVRHLDGLTRELLFRG